MTESVGRRSKWKMRRRSQLMLFTFFVAGCAAGRLWSATSLWTFTTPDPVLASPVIALDGTVYLGSYDRKVYALTPGGGVKWTNDLPPPIYIYFATYTAVYGTPAIGADGTLYVPSENGKLLALNPTNGAVKWEYGTVTPDGLYSSPALASDGTIYFGSYDQNLYAINPNGTRKWASRFDATIFASPAVGRDGTIYCGCDDGKLYALNPSNGLKKWTFNTGAYSISASPAIDANGTLYLGVGSVQNPKFYSISTNGATNWIFTTGSRVRSSAALGADGTIYFGCDDGKFYALNPDGTQRWAFPAGGAVGSSPAVASDGTIYFGCDDGNLYALDGNGNLLWTFQTGDDVFASPAIGPDGTIYFASADGVLYVLRGCRPPVVSDWPMFRYDAERSGRAPAELTNHPPVLAPIADRTLLEGATLTLTNSATDPDTPAQQLRFLLGAGAPVGATINPTNGVFQWTPAAGTAFGSNWISVAVTDSGSPRLSDVQCFTVGVVPRPNIESIVLSNASVTLRWRAWPGRNYRVHYETNLNATVWPSLSGDVPATSEFGTKSDAVAPGVAQRFYRVELLP